MGENLMTALLGYQIAVVAITLVICTYLAIDIWKHRSELKGRDKYFGLAITSIVTEFFDMYPIRPEISASDYDTYEYEPVRFAVPSHNSPVGVVYQEGAYFMLMKSPAEERECRFATDVEFSDGKILSAQCQAVTLY